LLSYPSESQVVALWQSLLASRTELTTEEGEALRIIYPGRINDDRGPDFRDAIIATKLGLLKGDIEVHVNSSNWQAHRHYQDPAYNQVLLHRVASLPELALKSLDLYRRYPKLTVNSVERHMNNQLGLDQSLVNSAQRQQGLIHIHKSFCTQGKCYFCRLRDCG